MSLQKVGEYAFLLGVIVAVLAGLIAVFSASTLAGIADWIVVLLVILGIIIGLLNIKDKETSNFLIAAIALAIGAAAFSALDVLVTPLGGLIGQILAYIAVFVAPAAIIVALKAVWNLAKAA